MSLELHNYIRDVKDFPKEGIIFKDVTTLLKDNQAFQQAHKELFALSKDLKIDKVVGIESRGFIFGALLAQQLNAGFIPIRKPKKLPAEVISETYALEYGTDTIEIHNDAIQKGDRILLHDDLLATGGTARAAINLIEKAGGEIIQVSFLIELAFLKGREALGNYDIQSVLKYH